jgi:2-C-methyl-D-erythritol 2,4-cyclodiphosphate synthase
MAVGFGYDIHRLVPGRRLVLGGVEIPHAKGLLGHSDADVLLHAVADAILGAAGLGDLGRLFPDSDPAWKDASSEALLDRVMEKVRPAWTVVNVDATVVAEEPRLAPHHEAIRRRLAVRVGTDRVSVKAKTNEGLGPVGAREAIACYAVAELKEKA